MICYEDYIDSTQVFWLEPCGHLSHPRNGYEVAGSVKDNNMSRDIL